MNQNIHIWETEELIKPQEKTFSFIGLTGNRSLDKIGYRCEHCLEDKTLFKFVKGNTMYIFCLQCGSFFILQRYKNKKLKNWRYRIKRWKGKGIVSIFYNEKYYIIPLMHQTKNFIETFEDLYSLLRFDKNLSYVSKMMYPRINIDNNICYVYGSKTKARYLLNYLICLSDIEKFKFCKFLLNIYTCLDEAPIKYDTISKENYKAMLLYRGYKYKDAIRIRESIKSKGYLS